MKNGGGRGWWDGARGSRQRSGASPGRVRGGAGGRRGGEEVASESSWHCYSVGDSFSPAVARDRVSP
jgi:hypothetical protein